MTKRGKMLMDTPDEKALTSNQTAEVARAITFSKNLHKFLNERDMTQSDLARAIWGETTTPDGKTVAKGRDRISVYLKGNVVPAPATLRKLAEALDVPVEELAPDIMGVAVDRDNPEFAVSTIAGHPDKSYVRLNKLMPFRYALEIGAIVERADRAAKGLLKEED